MGSRLEKKSNEVRKRIENHEFGDEEGDEYEASTFGGFGDYFRRKKIKLQNLDAEIRSRSSDKPPIFKGVVVHVNGYTQPSLNDLHKLVVSHHGGFLQYLDGKTMVTHIIASTLTPKKAQEFKKYRIVKPAWIVDSIQAGKLLPWSEYRVLDEGPHQKLLGFTDGKITNQKNNDTRSYREQSDTSWYARQLGKSGDGFEEENPSKPTEQVRQSQVRKSPKARESNSSKLERNVTSFTDFSFDDSLDALMEEESAAAEKDVVVISKSHAVVEPISETESITPKTEAVAEQKIPPVLSKKRQSSEVIEATTKKPKTAEEHNTVLLADPNIRKNTVVDPDFLQHYYQTSRLHHLSAWKAELKSEMQALINQKSESQKSKQRRLPGARRYVLHVDFDCFFAAIAMKKNPAFRDKPIAIAHGNESGNSEIASCNYLARNFGLKNGMWMKKATELCPDLKVFPYDFPSYEEASRQFYDQIFKTEGIVQSVSVDEALVDITNLVLSNADSNGLGTSSETILKEQKAADQIALTLRADIKEVTECDVSIGTGSNILLAKLALRKAKPAGQHQILPEDILDFIAPLAIQDLPGVAWNIGSKLEQIGIQTIKDARNTSKEKLINTLGPKTGQKIWEYSRGIDTKEVGDIELRKSVSAEINWGVRFENHEQVDEFISSLCEELQKRLLKENVKGKQLTLKVMRRRADAPLDPPKHLGHGLCDTFNKSIVLGVATIDHDIITKEALTLLKFFKIPPGELRGLGIQMTKLEPIKDKLADNSQKQLQFKPILKNQPKGKELEQTERPESERLENERHQPEQLENGNNNRRLQFKTQAIELVLDPIEESVVTPTKPKSKKIEFGADELNVFTPTRKELNTKGTQFILPTQVDQNVLSELPSDVRSRLIKAGSKGKTTRSKPSTSSDAFSAFPSHSQIDLETFNALPKDMQQEIMDFYGNDHFASVVPSKEVQTVPTPVKKSLNEQKKTPTKLKPTASKRRGRPPKTTVSSHSNFITAHFRRTTPDTGSGSDTKPSSRSVSIEPTVFNQAEPLLPTKLKPDEGIDPEYLAALPEYLREEVLAAHRQQKIREKNTALKETRRQAEQESILNKPAQPVIRLQTKIVRPSFTSAKLENLPDLRKALTDWVKEFDEEGPYEEDVDAFIGYLKRVVVDEGNMDKAVSCVKWLDWLVNDEDGKPVWFQSATRIADAVQTAIKSRGLGPVTL